MLDELMGSNKRRRLVDPPLIAMVGVLSMLIMFLVVGTIFGSMTIDLPSPFELAVGHKKNDIFAAPQLIFVPGGFRLSFGEKMDYPYDVFNRNNSNSNRLYDKIVRDIAALKKSQKMNELSLPLNVVAERTTSYKVIFDVLKGMREVGFANMLFVSRFEEGKQ